MKKKKNRSLFVLEIVMLFFEYFNYRSLLDDDIRLL